MVKKTNMKNAIFIDIDTDREATCMFSKPSSITPPSTPEEAKVMIITDISSVCQALCALISLADQNGYGKKADLVDVSIKHLRDMIEAKTEVESTPPAPETQG